MLRRYDHGVDSSRLPSVVLDCHLRLAVRQKPGNLATLPGCRETATKTVSKRDRKWHHLLGLVAGEADHHALVAGPNSVESVDLFAGPNFDRMRDPTQDLRTLILDRYDHATG